MRGMGRVEARGRAWGMEGRGASAETDGNRFHRCGDRGAQAGLLMRIASNSATTVPGRQAPRINRVVVTPRSGSP